MENRRRSGDPERKDADNFWTDTYLRLAPTLYRFFIHRVQNEDDAADLLSETFLKGLEAFQGLKYSQLQADIQKDPRNLIRTFLVIARNTFIDQFTKKNVRVRNQVDIKMDKLHAFDPTPEEWVEAQQDFERGINHLNDRLTPTERQIFIGRVLFGYDYGELGQSLNLTPATSRKYFHYALKKLEVRPPSRKKR